MVICIDHGMRSPNTDVNEGSAYYPLRLRWKRANKKRRKLGKRRRKEGRVIHDISTNEYWHLAGISKARYLDYTEVVHNISSSNTGSFTGYDSVQ